MRLSDAQLQEIEAHRKLTTSTRRATVPALEEILYDPLPALDHGFIRVIDYMGDDASIVQAARVSYGKGTKQKTEDRGLIRYLMRHLHTSPFEMCEIKLHVKLPIFIARQWIRHRTANVNEYSARYSIMDKEFYIPKHEHLAAQSTINNQGRGKILDFDQAQRVMDILKEDAERAYENYAHLLNEDEEGQPRNPEQDGLARELARMNLPVNFYTQWYWKVDLHNFMHFLNLRADPHAQYEIRVYADILLDVLKRWVPHTYEAFMDYRMHGSRLSQGSLKAIKRLIHGQNTTMEDVGLSKREWVELMDLLEMNNE